jgi:hypothetical protein
MDFAAPEIEGLAVAADFGLDCLVVLNLFTVDEGLAQVVL